jgi:hypothetical protein
MLQAGQLIDSALGRARYELLPQFVAVYGLRPSVPIYSHVVQSIEGGMRGVGGVRRYREVRRGKQTLGIADNLLEL